MHFSKIILTLLCLIVYIPIKASEAPQISLLTCHAGPEIYELCGHSGIRIRYPQTNIDYVVNYGLFDFASPNFIYRFVKGETDYMVGAQPYESFIGSYQRQGRRVVEQQLSLTPTQSNRLVDLLEENLRPQNRVYRYNYVLNNCATRCIDIIERAICDTITFYPSSVADTDGWSFRDEMRYFHRNYPWYQFGIDLALGSGIDYPISVREKSFAPETMERLFAGATIKDSIGSTIPLVYQTNIVVSGIGESAIKDPTPWYITPLAVGCLILIISIIISIIDIMRKCHNRIFDTTLYSVFGLAGCLILFLVVASEHYATSPNWLLVWLNPLCFIGAILPWTKKFDKIAAYYHKLNFWALFLLLSFCHLTGQEFNIAFCPLILSDVLRSCTYTYLYSKNAIRQRT
jgi:hypothetical protein